MEELINRLKTQVGLTTEQAAKSIEVVKDFTKEQFPMFADAIDKLFEQYGSGDKDDFLE